MPKRSNDFQKLILLINGCLQESGQVQESALLDDKITGEEREVDILLSSLIADYPVSISIEVIDKKRKADVLWVEQMHSKHLTLPTDKLVLVARSGFTKSAREKAHFYNIETITLEEALTTDWDLAIRMLTSGFLKLITFHCNTCHALCGHPGGNKVFSPVKRDTTVYLPYRDTPTDFEKMVQFFLAEPQLKEVLDEQLRTTDERAFTIEYTPHPGTFVLDEDQTQMPLLKFSVELEVEQTETPISFSVGRYRKHPVVFGASSDPNIHLHYALVKRNANEVEGLLYDKEGIRKLTNFQRANTCPEEDS